MASDRVTTAVGPGERRRERFLYLVMIGGIVTACAILYLASIAYRAFPAYQSLKRWTWTNRFFAPHPTMSYLPIPNTRGAMINVMDAPMPVRHDGDSLRVPADEDPRGIPRRHPALLTLGCSYTYGHLVRASETFSFLAGEALGGTALNAGVPGHGLAQMVLRARELVPKLKPDYVVAQYSPWLIARAISRFGPSVVGLLPSPYYGRTASGVVIQPPVFLPVVWTLPLYEYAISPGGWRDPLSFQRAIGLPLFVSEDRRMLGYFARLTTGGIPATASPHEVIEAAYAELARIATSNGAKLLIVTVGIPARRGRWTFPTCCRARVSSSTLKARS